jgi:hypothetical protein
MIEDKVRWKRNTNTTVNLSFGFSSHYHPLICFENCNWEEVIWKTIEKGMKKEE